METPLTSEAVLSRLGRIENLYLALQPALRPQRIGKRLARRPFADVSARLFGIRLRGLSVSGDVKNLQIAAMARTNLALEA